MCFTEETPVYCERCGRVFRRDQEVTIQCAMLRYNMACAGLKRLVVLRRVGGICSPACKAALQCLKDKTDGGGAASSSSGRGGRAREPTLSARGAAAVLAGIDDFDDDDYLLGAGEKNAGLMGWFWSKKD